jgi:hypothetical protein
VTGALMTLQHPKVTVGWAVSCLERAIEALGEGDSEARVRKQFHQLILALERDGHVLLDLGSLPVFAAGGAVVVMSSKPSTPAS